MAKMRGYGEFGKKKEIVQFFFDFGLDAIKLFGRTSETHVYVQKKIIHQVRRGEPPVRDLLNNLVSSIPKFDKN